MNWLGLANEFKQLLRELIAEIRELREELKHDRTNTPKR